MILTGITCSRLNSLVQFANHGWSVARQRAWFNLSRKQRRDFIAGEHDREADRACRPHDPVHPGQSLAEHDLEEEEDGTERLVLGGRAHPPNGEAGDKRRNVLLSEFARMTLPMKDDEAPNPANICLLGPPAVVTKADRLSHAIEQLWRRT